MSQVFRGGALEGMVGSLKGSGNKEEAEPDTSPFPMTLCRALARASLPWLLNLQLRPLLRALAFLLKWNLYMERLQRLEGMPCAMEQDPRLSRSRSKAITYRGPIPFPYPVGVRAAGGKAEA